MRSRSTITAAFALAAATILVASACGSSVGGSAAVNSAAAQTLTSTTESSTSTSRTSTSSTRTTTTKSSASTTETEDSSTTDSTSTDPLDLSGLPGYSTTCLNVQLTYLAAAVAPFATLAGGSTPYDGSDLQQQLNSLKSDADIPPEIAGDLQAIEEITTQANGKSLSDAGALFGSEKFNTASDNIAKWLTANCGG